MPILRAAAAAPATSASRLAHAGAIAGAVAFAAAVTGLASQVSVTIPGTVVPFTMQPAAVLLAGAALGARLGAASQLLYLLAGVTGASMFAWSPVLLPGIARLAGPTGGFLLAFPLAAFVTGLVIERGRLRHPAGTVVAMLAGATVLYAIGVSWVVALLPGALGASTAAAFVPYAAADVVKILLAAPVVPALRRLAGR